MSGQLTPMELIMLKLMGVGMGNKQMAFYMGQSEQTTKNHVTFMLMKLDAVNRTQAVVNGLKRGLIKLEDL